MVGNQTFNRKMKRWVKEYLKVESGNFYSFHYQKPCHKYQKPSHKHQLHTLWHGFIILNVFKLRCLFMAGYKWVAWNSLKSTAQRPMLTKIEFLREKKEKITISKDHNLIIMEKEKEKLECTLFMVGPFWFTKQY